MYSHCSVVVVLTVKIFLFASLREKMSVPPTKWSGVTCCKNSCGTLVENHYSKTFGNFDAEYKWSFRPLPVLVCYLDQCPKTSVWVGEVPPIPVFI